MKKPFIFLLFICASLHLFTQNIEYPVSRLEPVTDTFFGKYFIQDDYRWLERMNSEEVGEWIDEQNKLSKKQLARIPKRSKIKSKLQSYGDFDASVPTLPKKYEFIWGYYNEVSTNALMYKGPGIHDPKMLVDPDDISLEDHIQITGLYPSYDESWLLYLFSRNGSDKMEGRIINLSTGRHIPDELTDVMFSEIAWHNGGFFYSTFERENDFGITNGQRVRYHTVNTGQYEDKLIFERSNLPNNTFHFKLTENKKYFVLKEQNDQRDRYNIFYLDLNEDSFMVKPLLTNLKDEINIIDFKYKGFIASSELGSDQGMIIWIDPNAPRQFSKLAPAFPGEVLTVVEFFTQYIVAIYQAIDHPILKVMDYRGNVRYQLNLPEATSAHLHRLEGEDLSVYFYYSSYTIPPIVYKLDLLSFQKSLRDKTTVGFDFNKIAMTEIEYPSNDGEMIPMTIVHKKNLKLNGNNPTLLKAYGGFGIVSTPSFDPGIVYFVEQGGVYAFAHIRGGGEKGKEWADAGKGLNKQQSFDDFIAAAEYLIAEKYTSSEKLSSTGGSNGGLVVAAASIDRPDLFRVVIPRVAPLDMLRFEQFTVGRLWVSEYGSTQEQIGFEKLLSWSPYQNIKEDVNYPTMLIITSTHDDRVPPFHSYKFAAKLQNREAQTNPILLKVQERAGHYGSLTNKEQYNDKIDLYGFILDMMNPDN